MTAENERASAETGRVNAEKARVTAETSRQNNTAQAIGDCDEAAARANAAAEAAESIVGEIIPSISEDEIDALEGSDAT